MFTKNFKGKLYFQNAEQVGPSGGEAIVEAKAETSDTNKGEVQSETKTALSDIQETLKDELTPEERKEIIKGGSDEVTKFIEGIFGKESELGDILKSIISYFVPSMGANSAINWAEFSGNQGDIIEKAIISHRAGGYGDKPENSIAAIKAAVENGETEIELDFRLNAKGEIIAAHDNTTEAMDKGEKVDDLLKEMAAHQDITYLIDLKGEADLVNKLSTKITGLKDSGKFQKQLVFTAFNPNALKSATEKFPNQPVFFHYFPKGKMQFLDIAQKLIKSDMPMVKEKIQEILKNIDESAGTNYSDQINSLLLLSNESDTFKTTSEQKDIIHLYNVLPPESLLSILKINGSALSVPWVLVSNWPEFFQEAKKAGVKVAVFGFGKPKNPEEIKAHDAKLQKAIAMGANYIISDHPNVM